MTLRDLEGEFFTYIEDRHRIAHGHVDTLAEAHGVGLLCPACYKLNGGKRGTHWVIAWFGDRVPANAKPGPGRWSPVGTSLDDLTLDGYAGKSNSIDTRSGVCTGHFYIRSGAIVDA